MRRLRRQRPRPAPAPAPTPPTPATVLSRGRLPGLARGHGLTLASCRQGDVETWLATGPAAYDVRDFLAWAAARKHCLTLQIPGPQRKAGTATDPGQRWELVHRLLHDAALDLTDRVAGCLLLLFGQHLSRIAAMTTGQITTRDGPVLVRFGQHEIPVPDSLARHPHRPDRGRQLPYRHRLTDHQPVAIPRRHARTAHHPVPARRAPARPRHPGKPGRRAALIDLAAQLPAAILADSLNLSPGTAVRWMHQAGADWTRYAADIARSRDHQP